MSPLRVKQAFDRSWMRLGKPMATIVVNESEWTLIGDIQRDELLDAYVDSNGNKVSLKGIWETIEIPIVPTTQDSYIWDVELGGNVQHGLFSFIALADQKKTIEDCFRVIINDDHFILSQLQMTPHTNSGYVVASVTYWQGDEYSCS